LVYAVFYIAFGLSMLVLKLSLLSGFGPYAPDAMIPLVLALGLTAPKQRGLAVSFILGFIADAVTGHYLGLYCAACGFAFLSGNFLRERFYVGSPSFLFSYFFSLSLFVRVIEASLAWIIADNSGMAWLFLAGVPFALLNDIVLGFFLHRLIIKLDDKFGWLPVDEIELGLTQHAGRFR
jgi:rod shape-determining protein MreD